MSRLSRPSPTAQSCGQIRRRDNWVCVVGLYDRAVRSNPFDSLGLCGYRRGRCLSRRSTSQRNQARTPKAGSEPLPEEPSQLWAVTYKLTCLTGRQVSSPERFGAAHSQAFGRIQTRTPPPSTSSVIPVMKGFVISMSAAAAMSSAVPTRPTGKRSAISEYIPSRAASGIER